MGATLRVALVGNPNAGKTTLFNALSGLRHRVGNYPGVTVELKKGRASCNGTVLELIDLPGTYSLAARSPDEMVAVDLLLGQCPNEPHPDVVLAIVDASNLERHLYLTTQLVELGRPVVVALNMVDVAEKQGIRIDVPRLQEQLGLPVVPIQANKGLGLDALRRALVASAAHKAPQLGPSFPTALNHEVDGLSDVLGKAPTFLARRVLLDVDGYAQHRLTKEHGQRLTERLVEARQRLASAGYAIPAVEAKTRFTWIREALAGCVQQPSHRLASWTDRLDRILTHRLWGTLIFLILMFIVFQAIFTWARPLMRLIGDGKDALAAFLAAHIADGALKSLLLDGVLEGVGSVVVFLPQILILFAFIAILEDCGYMARAAFLMDKLMSRCGLSGKSFIPMLSSVACAVPGIMATRVIENRRDRLATILVAPLMSCSARLPVYLLLIGAFIRPGRPWWAPGLTMFAMYLIGLMVAPVVALVLKRTLLRGETPVFVMEMPVYKWPSVRTVLRRVYDAGWSFVRRAGTMILCTMAVVWALLYFPCQDGAGHRYDLEVTALQGRIDLANEQIQLAGDDEQTGRDLRAQRDELQEMQNEVAGRWRRGSYLGRLGRWIEPGVKPLGWDWRIGMATLASFPAREVVVGTLGIIYNQGKVDSEEIRTAKDAGETSLGRALQAAVWDEEPGRKIFTIPTALSLMVFFALCCQCASTLIVIWRETKSWLWPVFTFTYMTVLAYIGALAVYQIGTWVAG
jgi:ferrous iron transport protein B